MSDYLILSVIAFIPLGATVFFAMHREVGKKGQRSVILTKNVQMFFAGWALHSSLNVFGQDLIGLDRYLTLVENHWADMHWGYGLFMSVLTLTFAYVMFSRSRNMVTKALNDAKGCK